MVTSKSKTIRANKKYVREIEITNNIVLPNNLIIRGRSAPTQDIIRRYIFEHPNCTQAEIQKGALPDIDGGGFRHIMRTMVESNRIRQRYTID